MASYEDKYKQVFEKRFGSGSFESGLSSAREIGRTKTQSKIAKDQYEKALQEYKDREKNKTYDDALKLWQDPVEKKSLKRDGAAKIANDIRNDPRKQEAIKSGGYTVDQYIDALYSAASDGKFRSEREYNQFAKNQKPADPVADAMAKAKANANKKKLDSVKKKPEKKDENLLGGFLNKLKKSEVVRAGKAAKEFFNPFDDVKAKDAVKGYLNHKPSEKFEEVARGANRAVDSVFLGGMSNLDKKLNDRQPSYTSKREFGDGGGTDMLTSGLGYLVPALGAYKALNASKAGKALTQFGSQGLKQRLAAEAAKGSIVGAGMSGAEVGIREGLNPDDYDWKQNAALIGIGTAAGAVADPLLYGAGKGIGKGFEAAANNAMKKMAPSNEETAKVIANMIRQSKEDQLALPAPKSEPLGLPEPQIKLPAPKSDGDLSALKGLKNPIPGMPDVLRQPLHQARLESKGLNFGIGSKYEPKASNRMMFPEVKQNQAYWQQRYEDFAKHVNSSYDMNQMTPEALEDLWTQFARYDEPVTLDQAIDLAYPKGFEPVTQPEIKPIALKTIQTDKDINDMSKDELRTVYKHLVEKKEKLRTADNKGDNQLVFKRQLEAIEDDINNIKDVIKQEQSIPTIKDDLAADPRINEMIKRLHPPQKPISRVATPDEIIKMLQEGVASQKGMPQNILTPLQFKRSIPSKPLVDEVAAAAEAGVKPGRDFEPITQGAEPPPLARVSDELLDTQRQATGDIDSFRSRIDRTPKAKDLNRLKNLRTQFIDDVVPLETLEKQITGKIDSAENSLYKQARLFKGSPEKANLIVKEQLETIFRNLQQNGLKMDDLGDYALAVHAKDVNAKGINSGFTNAEIEDVIAKLGTPEMEAARKMLIGVNNNVLDTLSTGGIVNSADVAAMKEKWPNYVSLFRSFDDDKIDFASGISKSLANASSPIKKLEGSNRAVIDPMESIVKNIFKATNTVDRNSVAKQIGRLAEQDTEGNFIKRIADNDDTSRMNVISVMEEGKKVKYEVPPEVYTTLMNLDKESSNTLIRILQKPASWLRGGATLTPEFSLRNPLRDVPNAFVVSESGFNPATDFTVGLIQSIFKGRTVKIGGKEIKTPGKLYELFIKENGGYGNIISMDRELHRDTLKKALLDTNTDYFDVLDPKTYTALLKKYANPKHPLASLRNIADVSETATKVGEFRAAIRSGASPQEAAYRARDIMDFARAGVSVREANKVVAFLNANIQGKSKLYRAFKANPAKVTGKAVAAVTIPAIGAIIAQNTYANDKQREILNDAPQWLKDTFYLVPIPGTNQIARIPKPFDLAYPFANTIERAFDFVAKNDKEAFDGFLKQSFSAASVPVMLTGIAPLVEGMANYSFFKQGPIIPKREENMNYPDQYDVNTSETAKLVGKGINKLTGGQGAFKNFGSPRVVDNSIQGFFGGLGVYGSSAADGVINLFTGDDGEPEKAEKNIYQKPLAKAFLVNQSGGGESLEKLYRMKETLSKGRGSAKQNSEPFMDESKYKIVNEFTKQLSEFNKEIRKVENDPSLSGEEKRSILDELINQRNAFARSAAEQSEEWK